MLQSECGYTPAEIREMTLLDIQRLTSHWRKFPPLRALVAACASALGVKIDFGKAPEKKQYLTAEEFGSQVAALNAQLNQGR